MALDPRERQFRYKVHLFVLFLGFISHRTREKRMIYMILKKNLNLKLGRPLSIVLKIVMPDTVLDQFVELDDDLESGRYI